MDVMALASPAAEYIFKAVPHISDAASYLPCLDNDLQVSLDTEWLKLKYLCEVKYIGVFFSGPASTYYHTSRLRDDPGHAT